MISNAPTRDQIVAEAQTWLGTPYLHQASVRGKGSDCLGLVRGVWRYFYGEEPEKIPAYSHYWMVEQGEGLLKNALQQYLEPSNATPQKGQVLLFRIQQEGPTQHLGILSGEGRFIHAYAGRAVCESWYSRWWQRRCVMQFDFPGVK